MPKYPRIYRSLEDRGYKYAEIQILNDRYASIGVDVRDGGLAVWSLGQRVGNTPVSAKKVRKFARALLALADEVDPPAPEIEYYQGDGFNPRIPVFYRVIGATVQLFSERKGGWSESAWDGEGASDEFQAGRKKITADDLPAAAR